MQIESVAYGGWPNNLRLCNSDIELIASLDVGPRILSLRLPEHRNVLKNYPEQLGHAREDAFMIRGGHRLWLAPGDEKGCYHWDNEPVTYSVQLAPDDERCAYYSGSEPLTQTVDVSDMVVITSVQRAAPQVRKDLGICLDQSGTRVRLFHKATNLSREPIECATWALTVMEPDGLEVIPQPPLGQHPRDLLPNRGLIIWPYTDMSDPRLQFGRDYWYLRQIPGATPLKLGLLHLAKWVAYLVHGCLFLKLIDHQPGVNYPDGGCNFETFTNSEMIEIESLGPMQTLAPGESVSHSEQWFLFKAEANAFEDEPAFTEWMRPFLRAAGLET